MIYVLQRSYRALERLEKNLFGRLLFDDLLTNRFLGLYGREKVICLQQALSSGCSMVPLLTKLQQVTEDEVVYNQLLVAVKEQLRNKCSQTVNWADRVALQHKVAVTLARQGILRSPFPDTIFKEVMINVEKELFYLHELLPTIVAGEDAVLREDFLVNSGLDRFYVEELEHDYLQRHGLEEQVLYDVQKEG